MKIYRPLACSLLLVAGIATCGGPSFVTVDDFTPDIAVEQSLTPPKVRSLTDAGTRAPADASDPTKLDEAEPATSKGSDASAPLSSIGGTSNAGNPAASAGNPTAGGTGGAEPDPATGGSGGANTGGANTGGANTGGANIGGSGGDNIGGVGAAGTGGADTGETRASCTARFGNLADFELCSRTANSCRFYVRLNDRSCSSVCRQQGWRCERAENNGNGTCGTPGSRDSCDDGDNTDGICTCTPLGVRAN